ncbi:MAG: hypothetical protein K0U98_09165 [Deltaproteobacteria bacterium]|nr:hypothetical protein [Deltaproteobacteria bacterium]
MTIKTSSAPLRQLLLSLAFVLATDSTFPLQAQCPMSWDDAGVPIPNPDPPSPLGTPELSIEELLQFVHDQGITNVAELLDGMPPAMKENYTLVETTGTGLPSSVEHPRMILFGSDSRFIMAIATDPDDQQREVIDIADLDDDTGFWKFRSLDMAATPPALSADDSACVACHGSPARPIWGSYPDWPGIYGPDNDRLTSPQASRLEALRTSEAPASDRFRSIELLDSPYETGDTFSLPGRSYPYVNTVLNMELGAAVADGVYRRARRSPIFRELREEFLLRSYCAREIPDFMNSPAYQELEALLISLGAPSASLEDFYGLLQLDPGNDFSLDRLASEPTDSGWNVSTDSLFGLVDLLVLADLMIDDPQVRSLLAALPDHANGFSSGCFDHLEDALRYKIYQGWTLRGEARRAAREVAFDVDLLRSHQGIFDQATTPLCEYLAANIGFQGHIFQDGFESGDTSAWTQTTNGF